MNTSVKARKWSEIQVENESQIFTGNKKFDEWFSRKGGMITPSVIFVTGTSGAGKTTLMINLMQWLMNITSYFYSREMTSGAVRDQIGEVVTHKNANFADRNDCPTWKEFISDLNKVRPKVIIIDSLQAIADEDFSEMNKDEAMNKMRIDMNRYCEDNNAVCFLIGHVTKEGEFAGKNKMMHMCDAHMVLEAEDNKGVNEIRKIYWGKKNRKGPRGMMYYELTDGTVEFFTILEYKEKIEEFEKQKDASKDIQTSADLLSMIETSMKIFMKNIDTTNPNYPSFKKEVADMDKQLKKTYHYDMVSYLSELFKVTAYKAKNYNLLSK